MSTVKLSNIYPLELRVLRYIKGILIGNEKKTYQNLKNIYHLHLGEKTYSWLLWNKLDLFNNMDHMRISGTEPSPVILSQTK